MDTGENKKIHVLHLVDNLGMGGVQEWIYRIAMFADKSRFKHTVAFIMEGNDYGERISAMGCDVIYLGGGRSAAWKAFSWGLWRRILKLTDSPEYDIINLHTFGAYWFGSIAAYLHKKPSVYLVCAPKMQQPIIDFNMIKLLHPAVRYFITWYAPEDWQEHIGVPSSKIQRIPEGIALDYVKPVGRGENPIAGEFNISEKDFIIMSIGRLHPDKGHHYGILALKEILAECPNAKYMIVGKGHLKSSYEKLITRLGLDGKVILAGYRSDLRNFYSICSVYLHSSPYEPPNNSSAFAFAYGLPVVSSYLRPIHHWVKDGENILFTDTKDPHKIKEAVMSFVKDPQRAARIGGNAREAAYKFLDVKAFVKGIEKIYNKTLQND